MVVHVQHSAACRCADLGTFALLQRTVSDHNNSLLAIALLLATRLNQAASQFAQECMNMWWHKLSHGLLRGMADTVAGLERVAGFPLEALCAFH